jgi:hypothetical protein
MKPHRHFLIAMLLTSMPLPLVVLHTADDKEAMAAMKSEVEA